MIVESTWLGTRKRGWGRLGRHTRVIFVSLRVWSRSIDILQYYYLFTLPLSFSVSAIFFGSSGPFLGYWGSLRPRIRYPGMWPLYDIDLQVDLKCPEIGPCKFRHSCWTQGVSTTPNEKHYQRVVGRSFLIGAVPASHVRSRESQKPTKAYCQQFVFLQKRKLDRIVCWPCELRWTTVNSIRSVPITCRFEGAVNFHVNGRSCIFWFNVAFFDWGLLVPRSKHSADMQEMMQSMPADEELRFFMRFA